MKLEKQKDEIIGTTEIEGLIKATIKYKVTSSDISVNWDGPTIPHDVWSQILAFFKWTHDQHKSESQVRLYVNQKDKTWRAWAFPQKAGTGMTSEEIPVPQGGVEETVEDALVRFREWGFEPSGDWTRFGTVHHHCSAGAFQSSTDEKNEKDQDGLHITVGKIDENEHDLHCRFYVGGISFNPRMDRFFDIGNELAELLPTSKWDDIARAMMCVPAVTDQPFPDKWKENYIKVEYKQHQFHTPDSNYTQTYRPPYAARSWIERCEDAVDDILKAADEAKMSWKEIEDLILEMNNSNAIIGAICDAMKKHKVDSDDIVRYWPANEHEAHQQMAARELAAQSKQNHEVKPKGKNGKKNKKEQQQEFPQQAEQAWEAQVEAYMQGKYNVD
jgi:hypothetical protein